MSSSFVSPFYRVSGPYVCSVANSWARGLRITPALRQGYCMRREKSTPAKAKMISTEQTEVITIRHDSLQRLSDRLGHSFKDLSILAEATVHRSCINNGLKHMVYAEARPGVVTRLESNNEKLEFLGDRVLGLLATDYLFTERQMLSEGAMSRAVHEIVSRRNADFYCRALELDEFLLKAPHVPERRGSSQCGNFFEALLGALYIDGGYEAASSFFKIRVKPFLASATDAVLKPPEVIDYKGKLQEHLVACGFPGTLLGHGLRYDSVSYSQSEGRQFYTQGIWLLGRKVSQGSGPSKAIADQNAARRLLSALKRSKGTTLIIMRLARDGKNAEALTRATAVYESKLQNEESLSSVHNQESLRWRAL